jgi:3,4-dihydroxy 2-butanone 4-phosphate synthase/GTP cyclohydrolase II
MVILVDDEDRENEGDLCMAAEKVTPDAVNFMAKYGRGLICLPMTAEKIDSLDLPAMVDNNTSPFGTGFTVSIEARCGVSTGISAADRATTILAAVADGAKPRDLVRPGHVFPLRAKDGGVIVRAGQTEGSVDLARLSGLRPAGVICEVMDEDGTMARMPTLEKFSEKHGIGICTIADLIEYRMRTESFVRRSAQTSFLPQLQESSKLLFMKMMSITCCISPW